MSKPPESYPYIEIVPTAGTYKYTVVLHTSYLIEQGAGYAHTKRGARKVGQKALAKWHRDRAWEANAKEYIS